MEPLKQPKTFRDQVMILHNKGLVINNFAECEAFLSRINYYRLSGYYLPFIDRTTDVFFENIEFDRIKAIYSFDAELRNLSLKHLDFPYRWKHMLTK